MSEIENPSTERLKKHAIQIIGAVQKSSEASTEIFKNPSPRIGIFIACSYIEFLITSLLQETVKVGNRVKGERTSQFTKIWIAYELCILEKDEYDILILLNELRNKAVHDIHFKVLPEDIKKIKEHQFVRGCLAGRNKRIRKDMIEDAPQDGLDELNQQLLLLVLAFKSIYVNEISIKLMAVSPAIRSE